MKTTIIQEKKNDLFSRNEVKVSVEDMVTPSMEDARKIVADAFKADVALVRVRKVDSQFGSRVFTIIADIYDSAEEFNRIVNKTKQEIEAEKKAIAEAKAAEEAKKAEEEAAKAEAEKPAEEAAPEVESAEEKEVEEKTE